MRGKKWFRWELCIVVYLGIGILLSTVIRSGVLFQLDPDELAHANAAYLILQGYIPYKQFILTYSPVFHWLMAPILASGGFTIAGVESVRWFMVVLFILRVFISVFLATKLFGIRVAVLFILLFLIDPFTVFTAMQIRPDNAMMLSFTFGLYALYIAVASKRRFQFSVSGFFMALSGILLIKILPSVLFVWVLLFWHAVKEKTYTYLRAFLAGFAVPVFLLCVYAMYNGTLISMVEQIGSWALAINHAIKFAVPIGHFYQFHEPSLYDFFGSPGTLLTLYEYVLPILAIVGIGFAVRRSNNMVVVTMIGSAIAQSVALLFVHSVFVQYFLPVSWLWALFSAYAIIRVAGSIKRQKIIYAGYVSIIIIFLILVGFKSGEKNLIRSDAQAGVWEWETERLWSLVPKDQSLYPNVIFRPIAYPMTFGYYLQDTPESITSTLPPLMATLEKNHVEYIQKTYEWIAMPAEFPSYVEANFELINPTLYRRKNPASAGIF